MKRSAKISIVILSAIVALVAGVVGTFFLLTAPGINILGAPDLDTSRLVSYDSTVKILDKNDVPINDALYDKNKAYVKIADLPQYVPQAFIAIEDKRFYSHGGVDYRRLAGALISDIKSGAFREGASTITQQLIKNTHLSGEKTLKRKLSEIRLAKQLENAYSKDEILEGYLNILYFGSGIQGLGTASRIMFDKPASELTLAQSAALAAIINNPTRYSPYKNKENLDGRKTLVLDQMLAQGYITREARDAAVSEELTFGKYRQNQFTEGVIRAACKAYGCTEKELFCGNITLKTAYDGEFSGAAREIIASYAPFDGYIRVLALDNASGGILCDETNTPRYVDMRRSPASAIKPFVAYAPALERGYTPPTMLDDSPKKFGKYSPKNYRDVYRGTISLRDALKYSSNITAVSLVDELGVQSARAAAEGFGLTFDADDDSPAIALGGMKHGVTLEELANAYRTLANGGLYSPPRRFFDGRTDCAYTRAVGDDTAYLITDMLRDCARTGTAKKLRHCGIIAAKTGTNGGKTGNFDCYCVAYTPEMTVAVWLGAPDGGALKNDITGATASDIIKRLCERGALRTDEEFYMPESVGYFDIDGKEYENGAIYLAGPLLPKRYRRRELLSKRHLPLVKSFDLTDYYDGSYWRDYFSRDIMR